MNFLLRRVCGCLLGLAAVLAPIAATAHPLVENKAKIAALYQACRDQFPKGPQQSLLDVIGQANALAPEQLDKLPYSAKSALRDFIYRQDFPLAGWRIVARSPIFAELEDDVPALALILDGDLEGALRAIGQDEEDLSRSVAATRAFLLVNKMGPDALLAAVPLAVSVDELTNLNDSKFGGVGPEIIASIFLNFAAYGAADQAERAYAQLQDPVHRHYAFAALSGMRGDLDGFFAEFQATQETGYREKERMWEVLQGSLALRNDLENLITARHRIDALTRNDPSFSASWLDYDTLIVAQGLDAALALAHAHDYQGLDKDSATLVMKELAKFGRLEEFRDATIRLFVAAFSSDHPFARHAHFMHNPGLPVASAAAVGMQLAMKIQAFDYTLDALPTGASSDLRFGGISSQEFDFAAALATLDTQAERNAAQALIEAWAQTPPAKAYFQPEGGNQDSNDPDMQATFFALVYMALEAYDDLDDLLVANPELRKHLPEDLSSMHPELREHGLIAQYRFDELLDLKLPAIADQDRAAFMVAHNAIMLNTALSDCFPLSATKYGL